MKHSNHLVLLNRLTKNTKEKQMPDLAKASKRSAMVWADKRNLNTACAKDLPFGYVTGMTDFTPSASVGGAAAQGDADLSHIPELPALSSN